MKQSGLSNKIALITGAGQGIGQAVAKRLADEGAIIAAVDTNEDQLQSTVQKLNDKGIRAFAYLGDITDQASVQHIVDQIEKQLGPIYLLVNVAGILRISSIDQISTDDWHQTFAVNTHGLFYVSQAVSTYMMKRSEGVIVTVSSNAGAIPRMNMAAYAASKAAATSFTKTLGLELATYGIRCNVVSPGSTATPMQWALWSDEQGADQVIKGSLETYKTGIPLQKIADPQQIADAVIFFASEQSSHITMQNLTIDGGATLGI
ncbi:2,3-dihydro-2,3-dihydroxybenzoate dehydrogenase [Bacillus altitudinis]|uniref:2,3-dihydro-2,3-dihydroxybenzoate dehydrogenase n=1 Tax=Bacillus altitudinis TaxID=293387 RepID=UPI001C3911A1|nr:2,3-dihydro-2,3-dihydroxybenzoate dehydrogenase [Bacillus altitudinis]MBV5113953.1 2,3-dihydro-2,3-dihydroxybenzoate dehydrogenase [Bacillus altitudinis]MBW2730336.1 2,3-dihydro-2,3-dihydroxybenzoate dehydrogenase [Bacillus altitudinis]